METGYVSCWLTVEPQYPPPLLDPGLLETHVRWDLGATDPPPQGSSLVGRVTAQGPEAAPGPGTQRGVQALSQEVSSANVSYSFQVPISSHLRSLAAPAPEGQMHLIFVMLCGSII